MHNFGKECDCMTLKLPVGIEDFREIRCAGFYYVDKTKLIEQLLDNWGKVNLFTRPRRFGKTLNMSMLHRFFEIGADRSLFDGLNIMLREDLCNKYFGQFPVIFLTLKGVDGLSFEKATQKLINLIAREAERFRFLQDSDNLTENEKEMIDNPKQKHAFHGLYRSLVHNMVVGVSEGYKKELELVGVGYRASNQGNIIELALGYTHNIFIQLPAEVKVETKSERNKNPLIILESCDKQLLGQVCSKIRSFRKPEPYKGKGIKFVGEVIRRKSGKSAGAK